MLCFFEEQSSELTFSKMQWWAEKDWTMKTVCHPLERYTTNSAEDAANASLDPRSSHYIIYFKIPLKMLIIESINIETTL